MRRRSIARCRGRDGRRPADADLLPHGDRQGRAEQGRHARRARRAARRDRSWPQLRAALGWTSSAVRDARRDRRRHGMRARAARRSRRTGSKRFDAYAGKHPELAAEFTRRDRARTAGDAGVGTRDRALREGARGDDASRRARPRRTCSTTWSPALPELFGGSADLTWSNLTVRQGLAADRRQRAAATTRTTACASSAWRPP